MRETLETVAFRLRELLGGGQTPVDLDDWAPGTAPHVFSVGGQSNAQGAGNAVRSPEPPAQFALEYAPQTESFVALRDPVGDANHGSAWPAFASEYCDLTNQPLVMVGAARSGSGQVEAANPDLHWDPSVDRNDLVASLVERTTDALVTLEHNGFDPVYEGVLWSQGETDALAIDAGDISPEEYETALRGLIRRIREQRGDAGLRFYIFQTGRPREEDTEGFRTVRSVQRRIAEEDQYTHLVFADAVNFPDEGKMQDSLHYTQSGYNEMGAVGARNIVALSRQ